MLKVTTLLSIHRKDEVFNSILSGGFSLTTNKSFEYQIHFSNDFETGFSITLSQRGYDHAGSELQLSIVGFTFIMKVYDNRHWDYEKNNWNE